MRILASIVFGLLPIASHCLDAARTTLARRGILARALAAPAAALAGGLAPGAANAGIADQLEAASRASEITYSQNGKNECGNQPVRQAGLEVLFTILAASTQRESAWCPLTHPNV